ncbi:MAG: flippase [Candidatus Buchananbacteria bacterium]
MTKPNLAKNTIYFTAALIFQKILAFIYFWFISNNLFAQELGQYVFALSFTTMFSIFLDLGISPILTREAAREENQANKYLKNVIAIKLPLTILTLIAVWLTINISGKPEPVKLLIYLASLIMVLDSFSFTFWVIFRAKHNLKYESLSTILVQIIIFTLGLTALKLSGQTKYLILALLAASIFNFLFSGALLKFRLHYSLWPEYDKKVAMHFLKILPAFALSGFFVKIYNTNDSVLLSYLSSDQAVGYFSVPAKVVYALQQVIPAAFAAAIYPTFSYYYTKSRQQLEQTFERAWAYLLIISIPLTAGILVLIPEVVRIFWPKYAIVVPTFYVMSLAIPFIFLAFPTGYLLNACDRQKNTTINRGIITFLAVVLNISLIPSLSFYGAGITFLITNFVLVFLDLYWVRKIIKIDYLYLIKITGKTLVGALIMILFILTTQDYLPLLIQVALGGLIYFGCLWLMKGFSVKEILSLFKKNNQAAISPE